MYRTITTMHNSKYPLFRCFVLILEILYIYLISSYRMQDLTLYIVGAVSLMLCNGQNRKKIALEPQAS